MPETVIAPPPAAPAPAPAPTPEPQVDASPLQAFFDTHGHSPSEDERSKPNAPAQKPAEPTQTAKPAAEPKAEPATETPTAKPTGEVPPVEKPVEKMAPKELRTAYESLKRDHKTLREELRLAKEASTRAPADVKNDPEVKAITERLQQAEKRRSELEEEIKFKAYERSEEYVEKYEKPYKATCASAVSQVSELKIVNGETGESRQATADDFWKIATIPNLEDAINAAESLFGTPAKANLVLAMRDAVRRAWTAAEQAKAEYRVKGAEREKQQMEMSQKQAEELNSTWTKLNQEAAEKFPQYFKPEDGDDKGNELLERGKQQADLAFGASNLPPEQMVKVHSAAYNKIMGFDRLAYKHATAAKRIAELEKQLEEYKTSDPGRGDGEKGKVAADETAEQRLIALSHPRF